MVRFCTRSCFVFSTFVNFVVNFASGASFGSVLQKEWPCCFVHSEFRFFSTARSSCFSVCVPEERASRCLFTAVGGTLCCIHYRKKLCFFFSVGVNSFHFRMLSYSLQRLGYHFLEKLLRIWLHTLSNLRSPSFKLVMNKLSLRLLSLNSD